MSQCYSEGDFRKYFKENMNALGLGVPTTLFDSFNAAIANAGAMATAVSNLGAGATMAELAKATTGLEKLKVLGGVGAAYYTGAVVGSIAVASGRSLACGTSISDLFVFMHRNNLTFTGSHAFFIQHSEILDTDRRNRRSYAARAQISAAGVRAS